MTEEPQPLSLTPPGDSAPPLVLTPPEPVAPVRTEQAAGLVPVDESVRTEMTRRATEYIGALSGLDARSPEFTTRIGEIAALGQGDIRSAAQQLSAETLRTAFQQIYRTLDAIDTYKAQATESMAATVESLTSELRQAGAHLERSRSAGALESGGLG
ncbi:toxic anion resistance protein [Streptomyces sp. P8-A8]